MHECEPRYPETLFDDLAQQGWAVLEQALPLKVPGALRALALLKWQTGLFHPARVGHSRSPALAPAIRGDAICWLGHDDEEPPVRALFEWSMGLRLELNRRFYLGLRSDEFHFARYDAGRGYSLHVDQHRDAPHRKISIVLYLNEDWNEEDCGALCLYTNVVAAAPMRRILPHSGRTVVFRSDTVPHEVRPGRRIRWSVAGWLRTD